MTRSGVYGRIEKLTKLSSAIIPSLKKLRFKNLLTITNPNAMNMLQVMRDIIMMKK